jgi:membrane associated rhomboid family serine protease
MFFPFRTDAPLHSIPWMNFLLILVNIGMYCIKAGHQHALDAYMLSPETPRVICFLTYAFLHASWGHVLGNMLFLYIFGNNVNDKMGALGYLAFYLAGAVFAGMGFVLTTQHAPVLGASGAVAAVTGAFLILFPKSNVTIVYWLVFFVGQFEVTSVVMIVFFFLKDLFYGVLGMAEGGAQGVAHTAHVGGSVFGFLMCLCLLAAGLLPRGQYDLLALLGRWNKRRQYQALVRQGYNPFDGPAPEAEMPGVLDGTRARVMELRAEISECLEKKNLPGAAAVYLRLKGVDAEQVLARQNQLDVANELAHEQKYAEAVEAYRVFLKHYAAHDSAGHVELMLGLILSRYMGQPGEAKVHLQQALERMHSERERGLAEEELEHIKLAGQ